MRRVPKLKTSGAPNRGVKKVPKGHASYCTVGMILTDAITPRLGARCVGFRSGRRCLDPALAAARSAQPVGTCTCTCACACATCSVCMLHVQRCLYVIAYQLIPRPPRAALRGPFRFANRARRFVPGSAVSCRAAVYFAGIAETNLVGVPGSVSEGSLREHRNHKQGP
jgi:hypothetical protein